MQMNRHAPLSIKVYDSVYHKPDSVSLLAVPGEPLVGKPKFRTPLYRTVIEILLDGESALQPSSLFCHTHTAYAAVARDTTAATAGAASTASSIRHRRLRHRPSRGRGAYQAGEGAPYP
eukprot:scaffold37524_cov65-Phaeocystis_antarctica.AAC.1